MKLFRRSLNQASDEETIARFLQTGNPADLELLFSKYVQKVYGLCLKYLKNSSSAEDTTMDIFEKLISDLKKHKITHFKAWLYTYSKNQCLAELRRKKPHIIDLEILNYTADDGDSGQLDFEAQENQEQLLQSVDKCMNDLNHMQRQCLTMFYLKNRSYKEIADFTGMNIQQVKSHIQNGKRNIKILINKHYSHDNEAHEYALYFQKDA